MAESGAEDGARYWAFISYSHKDAAFGRRLHRRLESYALPPRLVGRTVPQGIVPRKLTPIFRDREELPAANDLSTEVHAALRASRSLIVVCSPEAAASPWVTREIEAFRELHPDRPVLAAIRKGEPAECFPDALSRRGADGTVLEPLAADFRKHRDGEHLGLLKLVAGIVGVGLDELVQRDSLRRTQRVTAVTAGAVAAMIVMGVLTVLALNARQEAVRQRGEAEGLVEYMLTDLRDRLKGVGRLDVMTAVNRRALRYYEHENLEQLPAASLERRAQILHKMAEDDETAGNLTAALSKALEARRTTAALLAEAPDNQTFIFSHAQSEFYVALIDWRSYRFESAQTGFGRYAVLAARLVALDPKNADWQVEAGDAESNLATFILREKFDPVLAQEHFDRALDHFLIARRLKPGDADIVDDIADGYAWLADCQRARRQFDEARGNRERQAQLLRGLLKTDPKNVDHARDLLSNALGFAQIDLDQQRSADAKLRLEAAYAEATRIAALDPENKRDAKQKIAIGLFLAKAELRESHPAFGEIHQMLSNCRAPVARNDQETADFCALMSFRAAEAAGAHDAAAADYLRANKARLSRIRRSPRWGINFSQQLPVTSH